MRCHARAFYEFRRADKVLFCLALFYYAQYPIVAGLHSEIYLLTPGVFQFFLDQALAQGYSGAPVFYVDEELSTAQLAKRQNRIEGGLHLLGVQSSDISDTTGGKLSIVVPIRYLWEILESEDFIRYEKMLPKQ